MSDKKNIDRLFQEKFKDFDASPKNDVWKGIEAKLQNKEKKKRRVIPFWWTIGGAAAAILLLFAVGNLVFIDNNNQPNIVDSDKTEINDKKDPNSKTQETSVASHNEDSSEASNDDTKKTDTTINKTKNQLLNPKTDYQKKDAVAFQNPEEKNNSEKKKDHNTSKSNNTKTSIVKNTNQNNTDTNNKTVHGSKNKTNSILNSSSKTNTIASNQKDNSVLNNTNSTQSNNKVQLKSNEEIKALLNSSNKTENAVVKSEEHDFSNKTENKDIIKENIETKDDNLENKKQSIEDAIAEANTENENEEEEERRRWSIAPNVAPVYFSSLGKGSSIDDRFINNSNSSDITISYGLKGSYTINKRLKITTGINSVNLSNTTNGVIAITTKELSVTVSPLALNSVGQTRVNNLGNVQLNSNNNDGSLVLLSRANVNSIPESISVTNNGDLNQNFGFIEIPLEVDYRLIDKKLGVNLSGGFSTLLLNENEISASIDGQNTRIGKANNINNTSFSANIGVGLDYNITEEVNINIEPKFKYQLNTFKNTAGNFRPFFIGVYTGLSFKF